MTEHPLRALARGWRSEAEMRAPETHWVFDVCADELDAALDALPTQGNALTDERTEWPGKEGTANGPRFYRAVASRFAAGESIASLVADYDIPAQDVVLAIRVSLAEYDDALNTDVASAEPGESGDATPERIRTQPPLPVGATRSGTDLIAELRFNRLTADLESANKRLAAVRGLVQIWRDDPELEWSNELAENLEAVLGEESGDNG